MNQKWKFDDAPNTACITTVDVLQKNAPITDVYHDYGGDWQFLNDTDQSFSADDAKLVSLSSILELDKSIEDLFDLGFGWRATRKSATSKWTIEKNHRFPTFTESGYYLENADWNAEYLDEVNPPPMDEREALLPERWCKLIFRFRDEMSDREDYDTERMWVEITDVDDHDFYTGVLQNTPSKNEGLATGATIHFHPTHIIAIHADD